jgi:hypothetical protein
MRKNAILCSLLIGLLFLWSGSARARILCVDPAGDSGKIYSSLQDALDEASANGEDDTIQIVQGTYNGNFVYNSSEGYGIVIKGGFAAGCTEQEIDPEQTILDGNGAGRVLFIQDTKGGDIRVENVTVRGGVRGGSGNDGAGIYARSYSYEAGEAGNIAITRTIIMDNHAVSAAGGGVYASSYASGGASDSAGNITLTNNIIAGNRITGDFQRGGGVFAHLYSSAGSVGEISLLNNTITENRAAGNGAGAFLSCVSTDQSGMVSAYNNIIRGNEGGYGADLYIPLSTHASYGYHNNYHDKAGSSWTEAGENIDVSPDFVSPGIWDDSGTPGNLQDDVWTAGNYRLRAGSPCIDAGILSRQVYVCNPGCMWLYFSYAPETDFEGDERTDQWHAFEPDEMQKYCDIGADEWKPPEIPALSSWTV